MVGISQAEREPRKACKKMEYSVIMVAGTPSTEIKTAGEKEGTQHRGSQEAGSS